MLGDLIELKLLILLTENYLNVSLLYLLYYIIKMGDNNRNLREDRIDVLFRDSKFIETLKKWKQCCKSLNGGQTERLQHLITEDLKKIKNLAMAELEKI